MRGQISMAVALMALATAPAIAQAQSPNQTQEAFDMRPVTGAVDSLRQLRSCVDSAPARLKDVFFVSQEVHGECYSKCVPGPQGRRICSGNKGSYSFRFDVNDLKPKFNVPLNKHKTLTAAYAPQFQLNLEHWANAVKRTSRDMDDAEEAATKLQDTRTENELRVRRKHLLDALEAVNRDLAQVARRVAVIRQSVAGYLVQEGDARKEFESARSELQDRLNGLNQKIQHEMSTRACADGPTAQYVSFQQTAIAHVNSIAGVYDDVNARILAADRAGSLLLSETNRMTEHLGLVEEELKSASDLVETKQALAAFHGAIAVKAWKEYAAHVEGAVVK